MKKILLGIGIVGTLLYLGYRRTNYMKAVHNDFVVPDEVMELCQILKDNDKDAFVVGGPVRDLVMGRIPNDWDLATNTRPNETMGIFESLGYKVVPIGEEFGTIAVIGKDGDQYEITTYRGEEVYKYDDRHPDVVFSDTIDSDVSRRDFTINAMAYDPIEDYLIDSFEGMKDIQNGIIRAVGNPDERFIEDPLRMFRAIRFACRYDFDIESETLQAIITNAHLTQHISMERIRDEFNKILLSPNPVYGVEILAETGLLEQFLPELSRLRHVLQNPKYHKADVFGHSLSVLDNAAGSGDLILLLAALLHDTGKYVTRKETAELRGEPIHGVLPLGGDYAQHEIFSRKIATEVLRRLKYPNNIRKPVEQLVGLHMAIGQLPRSKVRARRFVRNNKKYLDRLYQLHRCDIAGCKTALSDEDEDRLQHKYALLHIPTEMKLAIDGNQIMQILSLDPKTQGPKVKEVLHQLWDIVDYDPSLNTKEYLTQLLKNRVAKKGGKKA